MRKSVPAKERTAQERVRMPEADPAERIKSLTREVNTGLTAEQAVREARRCLDCAHPGCMEGCPVGIHIPTFIKNVERGEFALAAQVIRESSTLPAVCGRVCPQEKQCEKYCLYAQSLKKEAVAIGYLERFVADYEREHPARANETGAPSDPAAHQQEANAEPEAEKSLNGRTFNPAEVQVAVAGSGPAGLTFAGDMSRLGYRVTVFEALHEIGGVLKYGIPEYRLPNAVVDAEIEALRRAGVRFETNTIIGKTLSLEDLRSMGYRLLFVAGGAGLPNFMGIPGENLVGVMSSNEYLTRVNLMHAGSEGSHTPVFRGKNVAVIGGGNTAMDSVRTAKRLGAERAMIIYRRSREEMPARVEEVHHALQEGVEFLNLHNPVEYRGDERGRVKSVILQKMQLGEPGPDGRRRPEPIPGALEELPVDEVIVSIGVSPNPIIPNAIPQLERTAKGTIVVNEDNQTAVPYIFAGGDIVRGGATVILAMGDGRRAAAAAHRYLSQG